ncbi:hypothetical protein PUN28_001849 [Cardiocondyla obscurior]|uniref:Uncharacterized protein n=1 Tax=Cardiocondyla obscurior TaxID=286306 RepID=A0AAW2GRJ6_9HYME
MCSPTYHSPSDRLPHSTAARGVSPFKIETRRRNRKCSLRCSEMEEDRERSILIGRVTPGTNAEYMCSPWCGKMNSSLRSKQPERMSRPRRHPASAEQPQESSGI